MPVFPPRSRGAPPPFPRPRRARHLRSRHRPRPTTVTGPELSLEQVQEAWPRSVLPAVQERSIPIATLLSEASPIRLEAETLTLAFQPGADFHRKQVDEPKNLALVRDALYEVTGRRLAVVTEVGEASDDDPTDERSAR